MRDKAVPGQPYLIGSVEKALTVLRVLRDRGPVGVSELGAELDVARSTAHRILGTLMHHGFVEQDRVTRAYRLGPFLTGIGVESVPVAELRDLAMPHLRTLSTMFRETAQLVVLEGSNCRFVDGINADRPLNTTVRAGTVLPAYSTASGKALLAELDDGAIRSLFPSGLPAVTGNTVPTAARLVCQASVIRRSGYARNDEETEDGISALAVPVRRRTGSAVAAVALSLPSVRMRKGNVPVMVAQLRRCAAAIGRELPVPTAE
jgi:DNA-binding IclR family transcriptional regulator